MATQSPLDIVPRVDKFWSPGNHSQTPSDFRYPLLILETLLGNQHVLVAELYHWMGLILQEQLETQRAEQCFVKFLCNRYALQREQGGSTLQDSTVLQAEVSLSHLWQAQGISSSRSFEMIRNLQESRQYDGRLKKQKIGESSIKLHFKLGYSQQKLERSEAAERELHAMNKDLQNRNVGLKDWNKELQARHTVRSATVINPSSSEELYMLCEDDNELQTKLMNVTKTKDRAIKTLKKYHQQIKDLTSPDRDDSDG
ncbi:hypothetical protein IV203_004312 [Nitzschia inconspicua]|uniref:Uncharacterized protein n=1 Tax=Nitzschia inconspicua TaxID=303405 RepID=A0A9K3PQ12_9STRA|nr:hypothetical protein IV203_004312 [Nitzschia inconspicua]